MEGGGFFPFGGDPEEILRGLREFAETAVGERQGSAARAVRDADAEHRRRAHRRRAEAGPADRRRRTSRRPRSATRCACSSPRRWRSSAPPARGSCARAELGCEPGLRSVAMGLFDRAVVRALPAVPRSVVRRFSAPYIAGPTLDDARRTVVGAERRGQARHDRRARRGDAHAAEAEAIAARTGDVLAAIDARPPRREHLGQADGPRAEGRPRAVPRRCSRRLVRDAAARGILRPHRHGGRDVRRRHARRSTASCAAPGSTTSASCCRRASSGRSPTSTTCATCGRACASARGSTSSRRAIAFKDDDVVRRSFVSCLDALLDGGSPGRDRDARRAADRASRLRALRRLAATATSSRCCSACARAAPTSS